MALEGFAVVGLNHRTCPVELRERFAFAPSELAGALEALRRDSLSREAVLLSTCNRTELYGAGVGADPLERALTSLLEKRADLQAPAIARHLYRFEDNPAVEHLFSVASGLDSMVVGESEILAQVKDAFRAAQREGALRGPLYSLFERCFRVAKRVRTETGISRWSVSVASVAAQLARKIFGDLGATRALVIGTGDMGAKILAHLAESGCTRLAIASRRLARAHELAASFGAEVIDHDGWTERLQDVDILMTATGAGHVIVTRAHLEEAMRKRRHKPLFVIDVALPRNVEPAASALADVYLYNIDDLQGVVSENMKKREQEVAGARRLVQEEVEAFGRWLKLLDLAPTVRRLNAYFDGLFEEELKVMESRAGGPLGAGERDALRRSLARVKARCLHQPLEALRAASRNGSMVHYSEVLHELFGLGNVRVSDEEGDPAG